MLRRFAAALLALYALAFLSVESSRVGNALTPGQQAVLFSGLPCNLQSDIVSKAGSIPDFYVNFQSDCIYVKGTYTGNVNGFLTETNALGGYVDDLAGNWILVPPNTIRRSNKYALFEESRTNSVRTNVYTDPTNGAFALSVNQVLTNPNFTGTSGTGWISGVSGGSGTVNFGVTGQVTLTGDGVNEAYIEQSITTVIGTIYEVTGFTTGASVNIEVGTSQGLHDLVNIGGATAFRKFFTATGALTWVRFGRTANTPMTMSQVGVTDGELITNGLFGTQAAPTLTGWTDKSSGTGSSTASGAIGNMGGVLLAGGAAGIGAVEQSFSVVNGVTYTIQFTAETNSVTYTLGKSSGGIDYLNSTQGAGALRTVSFTANVSGIVFLRFSNSANVNVTILAVSAQAFRFPLFLVGTIANNARGANIFVTAAGTTNGIPWYRTRFVSNSTSIISSANLYAETASQIVATPGQTWTVSGFLAQGAGSLSNITAIRLNGVERTSAGTSLFGQQGSDIKASLTSALTRFTFSMSTCIAAATLTVGRLQPTPALLAFTASTPVDISIDTGWAQIENNNIPALAASVNSVAGTITGYTDGDVVTGAGYTGTAPTFTLTVVAGNVTAAAVTTAGSTTVVPANPISVTGGTGTGLTLNVLYTDQSAKGFMTSPIATTSAAVSRPADVASMPISGIGSQYTNFFSGVPNAPNTSVNAQGGVGIGDGSTTNRWLSFRQLGTATASTVLSGTGGGGSGTTLIGAAWAQSTAGKLAAAFAANDQAQVFNGGAANTAAVNGIPVGISKLDIGSRSNGGSPGLYWNGGITKAGVWYNTRLSNPAMQALTTPYLLKRDVIPGASNDNTPMFLDAAA